MRLEQLDVAVDMEERIAPDEQLVQHHACAVDVRALVDGEAERLLRRQEPRRSQRDFLQRAEGDRRGRPRRVRAGQDFGDAEVEDLERAVTVARIAEEEVLELDVAVNDADRVRRGEAGEELLDDRQGLGNGEMITRAQLVEERAAVLVLHDEEGTAARGGPAIEHGREVPMCEPRERLRFHAHALQVHRAVGQLRVQELDDHALAQGEVFSLVDLRASTDAEPCQRAVTAPRQRVGGRRWRSDRRAGDFGLANHGDLWPEASRAPVILKSRRDPENRQNLFEYFFASRGVDSGGLPVT